MVILLQTVKTPENPRRVIKEFSGPLLKTPENPHYEIDIFTHIYIYICFHRSVVSKTYSKTYPPGNKLKFSFVPAPPPFPQIQC